jgi:hypothetical protein
VEIIKQREGRINRWRVQARLRIDESCWLAARGSGELKRALLHDTRVIRQHTMAHSSPIRVIVGDRPIFSPADAAILAGQLRSQMEVYRSTASFQRPEQRRRALEIFESAIRKLSDDESASRAKPE